MLNTVSFGLGFGIAASIITFIFQTLNQELPLVNHFGDMMSPLVRTINGYALIVYPNDHLPAHIHVEKANKVARVALSPVQILDSYGYSERELREIVEIVRENKGHCWAIWHKIHGK